MQKKYVVAIVAIVAILLCGGIVYLYFGLQKQKKANEELEQLAEMDKKEMENQYSEFAMQYDELKHSIRNDSLLDKLDQEQQRAENLLAELRRVKSSDAAEITRLKKELATVRAVLRSYILQVDSLQRVNSALADENEQVKARYTEATSKISNLTTEKENLSEKVAIAAQLDATGITLSPLNKRGKNAKKLKDITRFQVRFVVTKNITAQVGSRHIFVRMLKPTGDVLNSSGSFTYENKSLQFSAQKVIEYNGEEQAVVLYIPVSEYLGAGAYRLDIFADGQNIGTLNKTLD